MDAYDYWKEKFKARPQLEVYISDYFQKNASPQDLQNHIDIADWLIRWKQAPDTMTLPADTPIQPIQQARLELVLNELRHYWSEETVQATAPLIEDLDLEIKSVTYIKPNEDIPLKECVRRADKLSCQMGHPIQETIIISIHVNAAGNGKKWHNATGWCCYTYYGHSLSDELATCLYKAARHRRRRPRPGIRLLHPQVYLRCLRTY